MRPTCLLTSPATCPPRGHWPTGRTATCRRRAAAAISTWLRQSAASTCSPKTFTVEITPGSFMTGRMAAVLFQRRTVCRRRSLSAGHGERSRPGGRHRPSSLPLPRSNRLAAAQGQHIPRGSLRGLYRCVKSSNLSYITAGWADRRSARLFPTPRLLRGPEAHLRGLLQRQPDQLQTEGLLSVGALRPVLLRRPDAASENKRRPRPVASAERAPTSCGGGGSKPETSGVSVPQQLLHG